MAEVFLPESLKKLAGNPDRILVEGNTLAETLRALVGIFPELKNQFFTEQGFVSPDIQVFVDEMEMPHFHSESLSIGSATRIRIALKEKLTVDPLFSHEEYNRYSRQLILPQFGLDAQIRLKQARVLVIGAGGLGAPLLMYLAAAGIGHIGIVDGDVVEENNLHRQVLFGTKDLGKLKVEAAKDRLLDLNPFIVADVFPFRITASNALELISGYDLLVDASDNFPTRYLLNDAAFLTGKPLVYGSVFQYEGQVSVFNLADKRGETGPNYRDLYPEPPLAGTVLDCAEGGVLGVLPGIIGSMQANEVMKIVTGIGEPLSGRFFTFNALRGETQVFSFQKRSDNPLRGNPPSITSLSEDEFYGCPASLVTMVKEAPPVELSAWLSAGEAVQLVDVREREEMVDENLGGKRIPLDELLSQSGQISREGKVVVYCEKGNRSVRAIRILQENFGFENLYSLKGGIQAWINENPTRV
jgi:adenylyltransferase/sulfurtransferase